MKNARIIAVVTIALGIVPTASAAMRELARSDWWAVYGGFQDGSDFVCALMSAPVNVSSAQLLIEHHSSRKGLLFRLIKPSWRMDERVKRTIAMGVGYSDPFAVAMSGYGNELSMWLPSSQAQAFIGRIHGQAFTIAFPEGTEPQWGFAPGGEGIVEADWRNCIEMSAASPQRAPTQP